jgi:hypothetical protein
MSDETPKPIMPKRPYTKRAEQPAEAKPPKKMGPKKTADVEHESTLLTMQEKACALLAIEKGIELAAHHLDMTPTEVQKILDSEPVRFYLKELQHQDLVQLSKQRMKNMRSAGITRTKIEERLFEIMMLDPCETKGNIDGQVKAAAALADKFGYAGKEDPLAGKSPAELEEIVSRGHGIIAKGTSSVN